MDGGSRAAALDRVDRVFDAFARLGFEDLVRIEPLTAALDAETRAELQAAANDSGRVDALAEVRSTAAETVIRRFATAQYDPTFAGLNWGRSTGRVEQRMAVAEALADAATAALLEDVIAPDLADRLFGPFLSIAELRSDAPAPGSAASAFDALGVLGRWMVLAVVFVIVTIAMLVCGLPALPGAAIVFVAGTVAILGRRRPA